MKLYEKDYNKLSKDMKIKSNSLNILIYSFENPLKNLKIEK